MNSKRQKVRLPFNPPFYYGWIVLVIGGMVAFFSGPGQTYSISIFIDTYIKDYGWSRSLISGFYSVATLSAGFMLPFVGRAIDKWGYRKMVTIIPIILGITCLWMSFITQAWMIFAGFIFLRLFGQGSMTLMPSALVPQWFIKKRGLALSLMGLGVIVSSMLMPPVNNWLLINTSLRFTWQVWSLLLIGFMAPIGWIFVRNSPELVGLLPDGESKCEGDNKEILTQSQASTLEVSWNIQEATKTKTFWLMIFFMMVPSMINTGLAFHMVSIVGQKGFDSTLSASVLSIMAFVQFPLTFVAGHVLDQVKPNYVKAINFWILLLAMMMMLISKTPGGLIFYAVLHGIFGAFDSVSTAVIWPKYFGRKNLASIKGIAMTAVVIGSALGPLPFGLAYDFFKGYTQVIQLMMIFPILASLFAFLAVQPYKKLP